MRLGVAVWGNEVSPVFDFSHRLLVVQCDAHRQQVRYRYDIPDQSMAARAERLRELGVNVLVCGAISNALADMVRGFGITLIPWKCGPVEDILLAYFTGTLKDSRFTLPGAGSGSVVEIRSNGIEGSKSL